MAVIGSPAWMLAAAVLCLGVGLVSLALAVVRSGDRAGRLSHAVMSLAMAGMFSPWGDPVPRWTGVVAFSVIGAWFAAVLLRRGRTRHTAQHLTISSAAMVVMYLLHGHGEPGAPAAGGHAGHHGGGSLDLAALPLALVLAGYFAWHTWTCVERSRGDADPAAGTRSPGRVEPVTHAVMSALMAAMFLSAV